MSGICGFLDLQGHEVPGGLLDPALGRLARRGPERTRNWHQGAVALGHTLLATTPEAVNETMPLHDAETGCVITADARLDNRDVLLPALGLSDTSVGDGEILLAAYLRWGEDCPCHLLGDFAFAIWDPVKGALFCARDHMGMRPLTYCHRDKDCFAFSSEAQPLCWLDRIPSRLNDHRLADLLVDGFEQRVSTSTFYEAVFRLPPAHSLRVNRSGLRIQRYWTLTPGAELRLGSDAEYAEAFREVLGGAVRARLRSPTPVGSMLSGGVDSGAVSGMAASILADAGKGPLATFSAVGPDPDTCRETRMIHAAQTTTGIAPTVVRYDQMDDMLDDLTNHLLEIEEPFDGHMDLMRAVYLAAHRTGHKVVLDGGGSDLAFGCPSLADTLVKRLRLRAALAELRAEKAFWYPHHDPLLRAGLQSLYRGLMPTPLRALYARAKSGLESSERPDGRANPEFLRQIDYWDKRIAEKPSRLNVWQIPSLVELRASSITGYAGLVGRERYNRVASAMGIEPRDPFTDLRLSSFALSLPHDQLRREGYPKWILRSAMEGIVPEAVRWRPGREHLGPQFSAAVLRHIQKRQMFSPHQDMQNMSSSVSRAIATGKIDWSSSRQDRSAYLLFWEKTQKSG